MEKENLEKLEREMFELFAKIDNAEDFKILFEDLCTYNEVEQMAQRLDVAKMFLSGKTYNQINELTDVSSATLSRVSKCVRRGSGGYSKIVKNSLEKN